eukprot:TRINITY_DN24518_c0_g1_i1.p1 TRINITY_DN24518_c0_g1~~TRINITY_DN24518_c0_g1_i1.p1  ORF type:complete len:388 (+),score=18.57 TRINITY_DN24518_c0_g1_i1:332-1495(+)
MENDPQVKEEVDNTTEQNSIPTKNFDEELLVGLRVDENYNEPILHQVLRIAVYDEFHAYETYRKTIETFGNVPSFLNIIQAEVRHFSALEPLLVKYNVPAPINNWYEKIELPNTLLECCEVGVAAEIDNIKMYDNLLLYVDQYPDIKDVLFQLQAASYNNHLPAFRKCVAQHSNTQVDLGNIYAQYSAHTTGENMMDKMNEFNDLAGKFASGQISQEDLLKVLSNTNLSFIGGALLGVVGMSVFSQINKQNEVQEDVQEESMPLVPFAVGAVIGGAVIYLLKKNKKSKSKKEEQKMLPFVAGLAAGAVAVVAYNNNKKIRSSVKSGAKKVQEVASSSYEKTKEIAGDVKATMSEKVDCLKPKKNEEPVVVEEKMDDKQSNTSHNLSY